MGEIGGWIWVNTVIFINQHTYQPLSEAQLMQNHLDQMLEKSDLGVMGEESGDYIRQ